MKLCRVGNQTNSPDPIAVNSRVFVGNLNTFQCSKAEVERMFQRYGRIAGISMHKGYAFVQFANAFDARSACLGEDKRLVLGQTLDVNLVSEPKSHQTGRKRQNITKTGNDWDYYYDSYYASVGLPAGPPPPGPPRLAPPHKRPRLMAPLARQAPPVLSPGLKHAPGPLAPLAPTPIVSHLMNGQAALAVSHGPASAPASPPLNGHTISVFSNPDILICGNCREMYTDLQELVSHKRARCKLRFACKCHTLPESKNGGGSEARLLCSSCRAAFSSAWDLMVHVQAAHMLNIYQLGMPGTELEGETSSLFLRSQGVSGLLCQQQQQQQQQLQQQRTSTPDTLDSDISTQLDSTPQQDQPQQEECQQLTKVEEVRSPSQREEPNQDQIQFDLKAERLQGADLLVQADGDSEDGVLAEGADVAVASPAVSTGSDQDMLLGATLQCNLTAEPLKDEALSLTEPTLQSSSDSFGDAAWSSGQQESHV